jgi:hypothetical protein
VDNFHKSKILPILPLTVLAFVAFSAAPATLAYGNSHTTQLWQVTASLNCNGPSSTRAICDEAFGGPGGQWIWGVLNADGTGDATVTGCGHVTGGGGPFQAGAGHENVDILSWTTAYGSAGPNTLIITGETDTLVGHGAPVSVTFNPEYSDTGIPLAPGHYTTFDLFGLTAPGLSFNIQVTYIGK